MNAQRPSRGHTQNYLRQLLSDHSLAPRSSLGQCFLTDLNLLDILVNAGELDGDDFVLEVGTGTGSLTQRLAARASSVLSVEIDPGLSKLSCESLSEFPNVTVMQADVLQNKNTLNPVVLAGIAERAPPGGKLRRKLVANLPYSVATPVLSLFLLDDGRWDRFVVTIQKEMADRLLAAPGTKDYGSFSVLAQGLADVELLRELGPTAFWPRPKVSSAFVRIKLQPAKRAAIRNLSTFHRLARGVLLHRRKNLRVAINNSLSNVSKAEADALLTSLGIDPQSRAESLPPQEFIRLANNLPTDWVGQLHLAR